MIQPKLIVNTTSIPGNSDMPSIIYIHGTGVREPGFGQTFKVIEKAIRRNLPGWNPVGCYWARECGAQLRKGGKSIPDYQDTRAIGEYRDAEGEERDAWYLLYSDPLWELGVLAMLPEGTEAEDSGQLRLGVTSPDEELQQQIAGLRPSQNLRELIDQNALSDVWEQAFADVTNSEAFIEATRKVVSHKSEIVSATARAVIAQATALATDLGIPAMIAPARDELVDRLIAELGGDTRSLFGDAWRLLKSYAARYASVSLTARGLTYIAQRKRGAVSDAITPFAGDVLLYQTRGDKIRERIRREINDTSGSVILLAHSLGGIACVDLLIEKKPPNVIGLITVGSQSPLLYEMDCLTMLRHNEPLPDLFPKWLNVYDPHDFLSYVGEKVFEGRVSDFMVNSGQPFPKSHSAYWSEPELWRRIAEFARNA